MCRRKVCRHFGSIQSYPSLFSVQKFWFKLLKYSQWCYRISITCRLGFSFSLICYTIVKSTWQVIWIVRTIGSCGCIDRVHRKWILLHHSIFMQSDPSGANFEVDRCRYNDLMECMVLRTWLNGHDIYTLGILSWDAITSNRWILSLIRKVLRKVFYNQHLGNSSWNCRENEILILIQEVSDSESYGKRCRPQIENHKILSCWIIQFYLILNF